MRTLLRTLFAPAPKTRTRTRTARPTLDSLEIRQVPTVGFHGGAVLPHVEVQGLYLGSDFNNSTFYKQTGVLEGFLGNVVNSSYTDALTNAGYGTGRGTASRGVIAPISINKGYYLTDNAIQSDIQSYVRNGSLQQPDSNRLYVVFVEDNVAVSLGNQNSQANFLGYHSHFTGITSSGQQAVIRYAVLPYPGGSIGNAADTALSTLDSLTQTTSHEIGEAITDPDGTGYYDGSGNEIGDITNQSVTYLNGYAVQRLSDKNGQAITPAGATSYRPVDFVLQSNGNVLEHTTGGLFTVVSGVARISDQGVDLNGRAFIDVVTTGGNAYEYHDGDSGPRFLSGGVAGAVAGQGESYVLFTNGTLYRYSDTTGKFNYLTAGVSSISAGTDGHGVSDVDFVNNSGAAYEYSDSTGFHFITSSARAISAGQQGETEVLLNNGYAYEYRDTTGRLSYLASGVAQITAGTDPTGSFQIDLLYTNGTLQEYRTSTGYVTLYGSIRSITKGRAGTIDLVTTGGAAYQRTTATTTYLAGGAVNVG